MKTLTINVTQKHIDAGEHCECKSCPVALALKEAGATDVIVGFGQMAFSFNGKGYQIPAPHAIADFIYHFDKRSPVSPFTFTLEV
jgi:hypothetical protein